MSRLALSMCSILAVGACAFAQGDEPKIMVNLEGFRYPPIAAQARIQGNAIFEVTPSGRRLVSARSPIADILAKPADANLATWELPPLSSGKYIVTYHFEFSVAPPLERVTVPISSKFQRFFRRLVGARTKEVVDRCDYHPDLPPTFTVTKGDDTKIDVSVPAYERCLETETGHLARNSHL